MKLVASYGTLRTGCTNHRVMLNAGGNFIGMGKLREYANMYTLGGFPAISLEFKDQEIQPVVEVFEVPSERLCVLDRLEGYVEGKKGNLYERTTVSVIMDNGDEAECLIYHMTGDIGKRFQSTESPDWVEHLKIIQGE